MNNTQILAIHCKDKVEVGKLENADNCFICGNEITKGIQVKKVISSNFTNFDICKNINGKNCCQDCATTIKNADLRKNSFIADKDHLYSLKKNDIENYIFNLDKYVKGEFVVGITTSFKKHNSFRCRVNLDTSRFFIRQEDREYLFNVEEMKYLYDKLNEAYLQFSKDEILSGNYSTIAIEQFGLEKFIEFENVFKKYRKSYQFELLVYILNSERRNEYIKQKQQAQKEEKARLKALEKERKKKENKEDKKQNG